ncbi:MAG: hypothetical protein JJU28_09730 [Cyclobacteriaceae bacterium]|nr:hypothetical protein [Cyclobacteriaceae bacterium]
MVLKYSYNIIAFSLFFTLFGCGNNSIKDTRIDECIIEEKVSSKVVAELLILGKWDWLQTKYIRRGTGIIIESPLTTGDSKSFEFLHDRLIIHHNDSITEQHYEIRIWGEDTPHVEDLLVVDFYGVTGEFRGRSLLSLSGNGKCMTLINSYNDLGGDLNFIKTSQHEY